MTPVRFLKSETYFLNSFKKKYNAAKFISKIFYHKKLELLEKNIEKKPQKPHPKLKKYV